MELHDTQQDNMSKTTMTFRGCLARKEDQEETRTTQMITNEHFDVRKLMLD